MIKRTIYIGNPAYLKTNNKQLVITLPQLKSELSESVRTTTIPIEDIGILLLDNPQITITQALIAQLLENNVALITCNAQHMPTGLMLNLDGNTLQSKRFNDQIEASAPLKKQLWQHTVSCKIQNQAQLLRWRGLKYNQLMQLSKDVKSGDPENAEGRAAALYWKQVFNSSFTRDRNGEHPNNWLNYGYAILRACTARALVGSGLLATLGIHHRNQYNAFCLADDIMEPYRIVIDKMVLELMQLYPNKIEIDTEIKTHLLQIPVQDVMINDEKKPLMIALQTTTSSLVKCYDGELRKITYPELKF